MKGKKAESFLILNIIIFSVVAILHFSRFVLRTPVIIGEFALPVWLSAMAVVFLSFVIWLNWKETKRNGKTCAKILAGIFAADLAGVLLSWHYDIEFLGFTGADYIVPALFDIVIIIALLYYIKKK